MSSTNFSSFYSLSWIFSQATFGLTKIYSICFTHNEVWAKTAKLIYYYINFLFQEIYCFNSRHGTMVLWCYIQYNKKTDYTQLINCILCWSKRADRIFQLGLSASTFQSSCWCRVISWDPAGSNHAVTSQLS